MSCRANPADSLGDLGCISWIPADQYLFKATEHAAKYPGIRNSPVFYFDFYFKVTFDPGYRINGNLDFLSGRDRSSLWFTACHNKTSSGLKFSEKGLCWFVKGGCAIRESGLNTTDAD